MIENEDDSRDEQKPTEEKLRSEAIARQKPGSLDTSVPAGASSYAGKVVIAEAPCPDDIATERPPSTEPAESEARPVRSRLPAPVAKKA